MIKRFALAGLSTLLLTAAASAHPGHGAGLLAGLAHPLTGLDHLVTMLAIGLWAALVGGRQFWLIPVTFVCVLLAGAALGVAGVALPAAETLVLASAIAVSAFAIFRLRLPVAVSLGLAASFALAHGLVHGAEMPVDASLAAYFAGFAASTIALHAIGMLAGRYLTSSTEVRAPRTTS